MKHIKLLLILFFLFGNLMVSSSLFAQENEGEEPTDDLGNVTDEFQESFFEALKQKAIENNELALEALKKAEKAATSEEQKAVVNYEIGKNLVAVRRYQDAEAYYKKVLNSQGEKLDVMESLYDIYYKERDYDKAIPLVKKLIQQDDDYKEDLANLYTRTKQYDKALALLDELDESWGETAYRNTLRSTIYKKTGNKEAQIDRIESKTAAGKKSEQDYLSLIYLYSEEGNAAKAFETAKELIVTYPKSELAHFALYKFYLENGQTKEAISSMEKVFDSQKIDTESKYKVLGDFIGFVESNPEYESKLEKTIKSFSKANGGVYEKLGDYYVHKGRKEDALKAYEKGVALDSDNYSLIKSTLVIQIEMQKYAEAQALSSNALDIFPAQPLLYLFNGVANIGLNNADDAIEKLETGVDYIIDNLILEKDFYTQLEIAYTQKGELKKAEKYAKKANNIVIN